jgi:hypothetical protein
VGERRVYAGGVGCGCRVWLCVFFPWVAWDGGRQAGELRVRVVALVADVECGFVFFFLGSLGRWTLGGRATRSVGGVSRGC